MRGVSWGGGVAEIGVGTLSLGPADSSGMLKNPSLCWAKSNIFGSPLLMSGKALVFSTTSHPIEENKPSSFN
jgi:hypothetical protein